MQIYHIVENLDDKYGGPARSIPMLCNALQKNDVEVELLSIRKYPIEENEVIKAKSLAWKCFDDLTSFFKYLSIRDKNSTLLHINNLWSPSTALSYITAKIFRIPYVVSVRGMLYPWSLERSKYKKKLFWYLFQKRMLQNAACLHATEKGESKVIRELGIKTPIAMIANGVELSEFEDVPSKSDALSSLGLDSAEKYVLFLSRLHPKKGIDLLLKVWKNLGNISKYTLLIVGDGDAEYVKKLKDEFGQLRNVQFLGRLQGEDRISAFCSADFFVLPSYSENFGMAIAEALAAKLPVITTTNTPWEEIEEENAGLWIGLCEKTLETALIELMSKNNSQLSKMGANGYKIAKRYSWDTQAQKMKAVYGWILGTNEKPECIQ